MPSLQVGEGQTVPGYVLHTLNVLDDDLDPSMVTARTRCTFWRIIAAQEGVTRADRELHHAVGDAHEAGNSWLSIGMPVLGVDETGHSETLGG